MEYRTIRCVYFILKSQLRHRAKVCHPICQQKQNFWNMYSGVISVKSLSSVISLFSCLSSKSIANGSILSSRLLHIACVKYLYRPQWSCLDCFFQFLEELWDAMFVCRKRIRYHVSVTWIMVTQLFILHSHKKNILVVKIIVIFQNSAHHYLQTTSKDAKSVMLSYVLFITSHFSTLHYSIQRYFLFSLLTFH